MKNIFVNIAVVSSIFFTVNAFAVEVQEKYTIGVEELAYLPHYANEKGEYTGYARELLDMFAKSANIKFTYAPKPLNRLFQEFVEEKFDFKYPDNPYWQADVKKGKNIVYSDSASEYVDGVVVKPERKGKGVDSLKMLGIVMGFTPWTYMDLINAKKVKTTEIYKFDALLKQTISGRVDGAYLGIAVANYQLREVLKSPNALVFDPGLPYTKSSFFLSTIKYPKIIEKFNKFLKDNQKDVIALKEKYQVEKGIEEADKK